MKGIFKHLRTYIFRGLLAIVPLALSFFSVKILYTAIDKRIILRVEKFFDFTFPGLGVLLVLAALYFLGLIAATCWVNHSLDWFKESPTESLL